MRSVPALLATTARRRSVDERRPGYAPQRLPGVWSPAGSATDVLRGGAVAAVASGARSSAASATAMSERGTWLEFLVMGSSGGRRALAVYGLDIVVATSASRTPIVRESSRDRLSVRPGVHADRRQPSPSRPRQAPCPTSRARRVGIDACLPDSCAHLAAVELHGEHGPSVAQVRDRCAREPAASERHEARLTPHPHTLKPHSLRPVVHGVDRGAVGSQLRVVYLPRSARSRPVSAPPKSFHRRTRPPPRGRSPFRPDGGRARSAHRPGDEAARGRRGSTVCTTTRAPTWRSRGGRVARLGDTEVDECHSCYCRVPAVRAVSAQRSGQPWASCRRRS